VRAPAGDGRGYSTSKVGRGPVGPALTSTLTSTLTTDVEVDGDVEVDSFVDLDLDLRVRPQIIFVNIATTLVSRSRPRSYRCGLIVPWVFMTSRTAAHSIADPRAIV
jgi:hypothetical protein